MTKPLKLGFADTHDHLRQFFEAVLSARYDVEIDMWWIDGRIYLGHDNPQYEVSDEWLGGRIDRLWVHCKNIEAVIFFKNCGYEFNYFWHETDTITLTSKNYIWAYPGKQPIRGSIAVLPELFNDNTSKCLGICSDFIQNYVSL